MLIYPDPQIGENAWGNKSITYMGIDGTKKWQRLETYGGKLVEKYCTGSGKRSAGECDPKYVIRWLSHQLSYPR